MLQKCHNSPLFFGLVVVLLRFCGLVLVQGCERWEWQCRTGECITLKSHCNKEYECRDKSDEDGCPAPTCSSGMLQCKNGDCYFRAWHCDGSRDCADGTDETNCPENSLMPTSSIIGMSVAVGGLFILLIAIIVMITCMRRKSGRRASLSRRRDLDPAILYPSNQFPNGPIACPSLSGEIILREPPPRYTSHADLYPSESTAAVNFGFIPDDAVLRPPPCYTSHPSLIHDMSNVSICSSVEPPPSYSSQQDHNVLDAPMEGAINLSFCPDESDFCYSIPTSDKNLHSSYYSVHSMKSWADNLDAEITSLGSNLEDEYSVATSEHNQSQPRLDANSACASTGRFQRAQIKSTDAVHTSNAAKLLARIHRATALGRQYSSTPVLVQPNFTQVQRRVSLDVGDTKLQSADREKYLPAEGVNRRVSSALQLGQTSTADRKATLQTEANRAESTSCCNSQHSVSQSNTGGRGLRFWRNNTTNLHAACESLHLSQDDITPKMHYPKGFEAVEAGSSQTYSAAGDNSAHDGANKTEPRQLCFIAGKEASSDTSLNSWIC